VQLSFEASENKHHFVWGIPGGGMAHCGGLVHERHT